MSHAQRLKDLGKTWKDEKPASGGRSVHPLGNFQGKISKAVLAEGQKGKQAGHLLVRITVKGLSGEATDKLTWRTIDLDYPGRKAQPSQNITEAPTGLAIFKGFLELMEVTMPKKLTQASMDKALTSCLDCVVDYSVVQNGQWQNTYINRLVNAADDVDDDDLDDVEEEEEEETDDTEEDDDAEEDEEEDDSDDEAEDEDEDIDLDNDDNFEDDEPEEEKPKRKKKGKKKAKAKDKKKSEGKKGKKKKKKAKAAAPSDSDDEEWDDDWD